MQIAIIQTEAADWKCIFVSFSKLLATTVHLICHLRVSPDNLKHQWYSGRCVDIGLRIHLKLGASLESFGELQRSKSMEHNKLNQQSWMKAFDWIKTKSEINTSAYALVHLSQSNNSVGHETNTQPFKIITLNPSCCCKMNYLMKKRSRGTHRKYYKVVHYVFLLSKDYL